MISYVELERESIVIVSINIDVEKFNPPSREYEKFPFPPVTMISITPSPPMHVSRLN